MSSTKANLSEAIKSAILDVLTSCDGPLKRKKIVSKASRKLSKSDYDLDKNRVKKTLKALVASGDVREIESEGSKVYIINVTDESSGTSTSDESESNDENTSQSGDEDVPLPFAEVLRQRRRKQANSQSHGLKDKEASTQEKGEDIDDEIRRLEAELAADSDEDFHSLHSSEGSEHEERNGDDDNHESNSRGKISFGPTTEYSDDEKPIPKQLRGDGGILRSALVDERIAPLPQSALPQIKRRKLKAIDGDDDHDANGNASKAKKKQRKSTDHGSAVSDGLQEAVKEVLGGYVARSHERIPFYCRVCSVQSKDMESFLAHKDTDFHKAAIQAERKATYCQACRKQFTSPVQMREHLESKPHHDRMAFLRSRNQGSGGGGRGGRSGRGYFGRGGLGYGRGRGRDENGGSRRQWC